MLIIPIVHSEIWGTTEIIIIGHFFQGIRQFPVPWGRLSL